LPLNNNIKKIIISRTDAIGDVLLTLPVCGIIKKYYPDVKIVFLGRTYTESIINCCEHIDEFLNADTLLKMNKNEAVEALQKVKADTIIHVFPNKEIASLAKTAKIKNRIGTTNRLFHWTTVNKLVKLSRKNSDLHEAQLNIKLLSAIGIDEVPALNKLNEYIGFTKISTLNNEYNSFIDRSKINVILHPKSNASAREWSLDNFKSLINLLPEEKVKIFISGTEKEKIALADWMKQLPANVIDITGIFPLPQFIAFIGQADYLIAASTGPLHIASSLDIGAIGIYPPIRPMHPGRWQPIGKKAQALVINKSCSDCRKDPHACVCIDLINAKQIADIILK
jgi:ADP-heptose:LPS heptosyltransferase